MGGRFLVPVLIALLSAAPPLEGEEPALASLSLSFQQEGVLTLPTLNRASWFGWAAALSGDGNKALIGVPGGEYCLNDPQGICRAAYVFVRTGGVWSLEARLPGEGAGFGDEVALSADGNVALVHDPSLPCPSISGFSCGGVVVFVRTGGGWVPETTLLPATFADFEDSAFGSSLALSSDGSIALVGRNAENCVRQPCLGAVYVFTRGAGGVWTQEAHLVPSEPDVNFGSSVALSGDGSIALFGSFLTDCAAGESCGAVFVFSRSGGAWSPQQKLTASHPVLRGSFGSSLALSADGNVAVIGAPNVELFGTEAGSIFIFNREGGVWTEKREISLGEPREGVGGAVSLSGDGETLLAGGPFADCEAGTDCGAALWSVFRAGIWTSPQPLMQFGDGDLGGSALALSSDGRTALVTALRGSPCQDGTSSCGIAYVFTLAPLGVEIPVLDGPGLALLALLLAASGAALLIRRRRSA